MTSLQPDTEAEDLAAVNDQMQRIAQHQRAGRFAAAEEMLDRLLERYEGHPRLLHAKGLTLAMMGRRDEGRALLATVLDASEDPVLRVDYATLLAQDGMVDKARDTLEQAVELSPNYALAHANLGAALLLEGEMARAVRHLERAVALDPQLLDAHTNLGKALIRLQRFDQAVDVLYKALAIDPKSVSAHMDLAMALFRRERHDAAEHHARRALELAPDAAEARLNLGLVLAAAGRMEEAAEQYLAIAPYPRFGLNALGRLVHLRKTRPDSPELTLLEAYDARRDTLSPENRVTLDFAFGKAREDLGDHDTAMGHFHAANAGNRALHPFDRDRHQARTARLREVVTANLLARCSSSALTDMAPVFVCGMPRSGTTLMDQMFSRHPDIQAGGELPAAQAAMARNEAIRAALEDPAVAADLTPDDMARLGEDYIAYLHREGFRPGYATDKMPGNYLYVGLLAMALPRAKFIIMRRHPLDCLLSNYMQNFGRNQPFSADFGDLAAVYDAFDTMARYWSALLPDRVREVAYEDVVADPGARMREMLDFVGLDWSDAVLDHTVSSHQVNTASVAQVRQPIYGSAVARWRRYGPLLSDLAEALGPHLDAEERAACGLPA